MGILIGMDEAGYGPQLGPLVIAATAWQVPTVTAESLRRRARPGEVVSASGKSRYTKRSSSQASGPASTALLNPKSRVPTGCQNSQSTPTDLYRLLRNIVSKKASQHRIAIADSKALYTPGNGLRQLERGLHAVLLAMQQKISCWSEMVHYAKADPDGHHSRTCWPDGHNCALPIDAENAELIRLEARFTRACDFADVRPLLIRARLVFPEEFNNLVAYYSSKGAALSHITVGLLRDVVDAVTQPSANCCPPPIYAVCDKHGGRNFYTALLQHHFSEHWIAPVFESHAESHYEWGEPDSRTRVVFQVKGERFMPTALASMTAKYFRELSMRAFNDYWRAHVPELKPTAGYYRDAWRFKKEIAAKQRQLGIEDHVIWRTR